jgi:hypothetical protein
LKVIDGLWQAVPAADPSAVLTGSTADELRKKVRLDYASRQVSLTAVRGERMST